MEQPDSSEETSLVATEEQAGMLPETYESSSSSEGPEKDVRYYNDQQSLELKNSPTELHPAHQKAEGVGSEGDNDLDRVPSTEEQTLLPLLEEQINQAQEHCDLSVTSKLERQQMDQEMEAYEEDEGISVEKRGEPKAGVEAQQNQSGERHEEGGDGQFGGDAQRSQGTKPKKSEQEKQRPHEADKMVHAMQEAYELEQAGLLRLQKGNPVKEYYQPQPVMDVMMLHETQPGGDWLQKSFQKAQRNHLGTAYGNELPRELPQPQNVQDLQAEIDRYQRAQALENLYEQEQRGTLTRMHKRGKPGPKVPIQLSAEEQAERDRYQRAHALERLYEKEQHDTLARMRQSRKPPLPQVLLPLSAEEQAERDRYQNAQALERLYEKEQHDTLARMRQRRKPPPQIVLPPSSGEKAERDRYQRAHALERLYEKEQHDTLARMRQSRKPPPQVLPLSAEEQAELDRYQNAQALERLYEKEQHGSLAKILRRKQRAGKLQKTTEQALQYQTGLQETQAAQQQSPQPLTQRELKNELQRYQVAQEMEKAYEKEQHDHLKRNLQEHDPTQDRLPQLNQPKQHPERDLTPPTLEELPKKELHGTGTKISPRESAQPLQTQPNLQAHGVEQKEHQTGQPKQEANRKEQEPLQEDIIHREHNETPRPQRTQGGLDQKPKSDGLLILFEGDTRQKLQQHGVQKQLQSRSERILQSQPRAHESKEYWNTGSVTSDQTPKLGPSAAMGKPRLTLLSPSNHGLAGSQMKVKTRLTVEALPQNTNGNESGDRAPIVGEDAGQVACIRGRVAGKNVIGLSWAPDINNTVSSSRTDTTSYTDEVQEKKRITDVLRRLSTALGFGKANYGDVYSVNTIEGNHGLKNARTFRKCHSKTTYEGEVDEDTYCMSPSIDTQAPGANTVVDMVQDCFRAINEVARRDGPLTECPKVRGGGSVIAMVEGCCQVLDEVVQSKLGPGHINAPPDSKMTSASRSQRFTGSDKVQNTLNTAQFGSFVAAEIPRVLEGVDTRRLPSFPGLGGRIEVAINRPDVVGPLPGFPLFRFPEAAGIRKSDGGKATHLSAGDPVPDTLTAYYVVDDAKKKKRKKSKKKKPKKKSKKSKKKKKKSKKKSKKSKKSKKGKKSKRSKNSKKKKSSKKKSKKGKSKKSKSKKGKSKKRKNKGSKRESKIKSGDEESSLPLPPSSTSGPPSWTETVPEQQAPSPSATTATTRITQPAATASHTVQPVSSKLAQTSLSSGEPSGSTNFERYQAQPSREWRRRRDHRSTSRTASSGSSACSQRFHVVTRVHVGNRVSASTGSGTQTVDPLPEPKDKPWSAPRVPAAQQEPPLLERPAPSLCSNCISTPPPEVVESSVIVCAPSTPSTIPRTRSARVSDKYDDTPRRRSGDRRRRHRRHRSSSSTSTSTSRSRHSRRRHHRGRHHRRRSHEQSSENSSFSDYSTDSQHDTAKRWSRMFANAPNRHYGEPYVPPATLDYIRRRAPSPERFQKPALPYTGGYGRTVIADGTTRPYESFEDMPRVSMRINIGKQLLASQSFPPLVQQPPLPPPLVSQLSFSGQPVVPSEMLMLPPPEPPLPSNQPSLTVQGQTSSMPPAPIAGATPAPILNQHQNNSYGSDTSFSSSGSIFTMNRRPASSSSSVSTYGGSKFGGENFWATPYNFMRRTFEEGNLVVTVILILGIAACVVALYSQRGHYHEGHGAISVEEEEPGVMYGPWIVNTSDVPPTHVVRGHHICHALDCKREARRLTSELSGEPCDSFYNYVCSRHNLQMAPKGPPATARNAEEVALQGTEDIVWKYMRKTSESANPAAAIWKTCMNTQAITSLGTSPFHDVLNASGLSGWPFEEEPAQLNPWRTAGRLTRLLELRTLLSVRVERGANSTISIVLGHATLPLDLHDTPDNASLAALLIKVERTMGFLAPGASGTTARAHEVLNFALQLVKIFNAGKARKSSFEARAPFTSFLDAAVGDILDLTNGSVSTRFEPPEYGEKLNQTVATASLRSTFNYLGFYVVDHLWIYSPEDVAQTVASGQRERNCLRMSQRAAPSQTMDIAYHAYKNLLNFTELRRLTTETKQSVIDIIHSMPWMDNAMKPKVIEKVQKTKVDLLPQSLPSVTSVPGLAHPHPSDHSSALALYQRTVELRFTSDIRNSLENKDTQGYRSLFSRHFQFDRKGVLHVPIALVKPSVGSGDGEPDPTPYVALLRGTSFRMRLAKALLKAALGHANDDHKSLWTHLARRRFRVLQGCFQARFQVGHDPTQGKPKPPSTLTDDILEYVAVTLAHLDFRTVVQLLTNNATSDYRLADAEDWSSDQLFFVSYAQSSCQPNDEELASPRLAPHDDGPARRRVDLALSYNPKFHRAFHCRPGVAMRPRRSCSFW